MTSRLPRIRVALILLAASSALPLAAAAATATLEPAGGSKAKGQVTFTQDGPRIRAMGEITGLAPGRHDLHVADKGDCSAPDADGHGGAGAEKHGGDFGSITAGASGSATVNTTTTGMSIASLMGKELVLRAKPDEKSDAGARVACGVVK